MKRLVAVLVICLVASLGFAQQTRLMSLHVKKANVCDVIKRIAGQWNFKYEMDKDVQGTVDVEATRQDFHEILYIALSQVDAIWTEQDGQFSFRRIRRPEKKGDANLAFLPQTIVGEVDYVGSDIRLALKEQFALQGVRYEIDPDVLGTITVSLRRVTFDVVIANMLKQVDAMWTFTTRGIRIMLRPIGDPGGATGPPPPHR
jgi:type II secretory pathway component GspD/PulD (secretin)